MSCSKHFLGLNFKHHNWERQVTRASTLDAPFTDMWGRPVQTGHVVCHTQYVCRDCGRVEDQGECTCEPERGEQCAIRLRYLAEHTGTSTEPTARRSNVQPALRYSAH